MYDLNNTVLCNDAYMNERGGLRQHNGGGGEEEEGEKCFLKRIALTLSTKRPFYTETEKI